MTKTFTVTPLKDEFNSHRRSSRLRCQANENAAIHKETASASPGNPANHRRASCRAIGRRLSGAVSS